VNIGRSTEIFTESAKTSNGKNKTKKMKKKALTLYFMDICDC
jgi:hypothetical protein